MAHALDDWDLYMLRLVNRARQNPSAEAGTIGSSVTDTRPPVPPLAYHAQVGQAATNHTNWMHDNFGSIASGQAPDSFTHFETLNGQQTGTPAVGTPSYTGAGLGERITAAGFSWNAAAENIYAAWSTATIAVNQARIDATHKGWWESSGHRNNMLSSTYTVFGHRAQSRLFTPPRGGLAAPFDNIHFATQNYARPLSMPFTHIFGVLYDDVDGNGAWTPRDTGHPQHEGLGGVVFDVYLAGTSTRVAGGTTLVNGAFTVNRGNGAYDVVFRLGGGEVTVAGVVVSGANVDAGDILGILDPSPAARFVDCLGGPGESPAPSLPGQTVQGCLAEFDSDADGDVDLVDFAVFAVDVGE